MVRPRKKENGLFFRINAGYRLLAPATEGISIQFRVPRHKILDVDKTVPFSIRAPRLQELTKEPVGNTSLRHPRRL